MADRILEMGDIVTLVEQAQDKLLDIEVQKKTAERMKQGVFTFNDLLAQLGQISKMGSTDSEMQKSATLPTVLCSVLLTSRTW